MKVINCTGCFIFAFFSCIHTIQALWTARLTKVRNFDVYELPLIWTCLCACARSNMFIVNHIYLFNGHILTALTIIQTSLSARQTPIITLGTCVIFSLFIIIDLTIFHTHKTFQEHLFTIISQVA